LNTNGKSPFDPVNADDRITEICDTLSIGASIQNILLKATELGLGTLWIANTCFAYRELTEYLDTKNQLVGAIAVGYPDESPNPRPRKSLDEIIEFR
ncbi:MAG: nitroreductase family protein, partial [Oscillospiraceae bacterium]|nr:nitroreductase family protein [Oscillospiraceae bacterium]